MPAGLFVEISYNHSNKKLRQGFFRENFSTFFKCFLVKGLDTVFPERCTRLQGLETSVEWYTRIEYYTTNDIISSFSHVVIRNKVQQIMIFLIFIMP